MDTIADRQAAISVVPVPKRPSIIPFNTPLLFKAPMIPFELSKLLRIVTEAKTKPNRTPEIVERAPAAEMTAL
ncbi:TPA: hypothetical protein R4Z84_003838 [Klebsiella pneumoniae]|nr:hypothetical protein [Klebsiella pneumoniae]